MQPQSLPPQPQSHELLLLLQQQPIIIKISNHKHPLLPKLFPHIIQKPPNNKDLIKKFILMSLIYYVFDIYFVTPIFIYLKLAKRYDILY